MRRILIRTILFCTIFAASLACGSISLRVSYATEAEEKTDGGDSDETKAEITEGENTSTDTSKKSNLQNTIDQAKKNAAAAQSALDEENKKINSLSKQEETLTAEEEEAENHLAEIIEKLTSLQMQLDEITDEIEQTKRDLAEAEDEAKRQYQMMKLRIAYMYEQSDVDQITALLNKGSFKDMLNALRYMNSVYDYDRNLLDEYEATVQQITNLKMDLENEKSELEEVEAAYEAEEKELEIAIADLQTKIKNVDAAINNAAKRAKAYEATIAAENAKIKKAVQEQAKLEEAGKTSSSSSDKKTSSGESKNPSKVTGVSGSAVVDYACQFVGNPYVFGGNSLTGGTDCSGFVNLIMGHFGVGVPRSSYALQSAGSEVSYDSAQPGDIVCYPGHVAIYMGGGKIVHAKNSNCGIVTDSILYSSKGIITIRRVL